MRVGAQPVDTNNGGAQVNIFYIIGVVVVVLIVLGYLGLR
jgi:hypothetical protein